MYTVKAVNNLSDMPTARLPSSHSSHALFKTYPDFFYIDYSCSVSLYKYKNNPTSKEILIFCIISYFSPVRQKYL